LTVPNEVRCLWTRETHILELAQCCPISGNPQPGSKVAIEYEPNGTILEVAALRSYLDSFVGGKGSVRSMEGMIQMIAQECSQVLSVQVKVQAELIIEPNQRMEVICVAVPNR
jgi:7-cyano-7-deazaguanine reductase